MRFAMRRSRSSPSSDCRWGCCCPGAILTETIFSWPGVGNWLIHGVQSRDYPVVQGGILLIAALVISVNLVVDLLYGVANPRIRHA